MPNLIRPGTVDYNAIKRESYYLTAFYNGQAYSLGYCDVGTLNITISPRIVTKEVDQLATTRAKADMLGYEASISATLSGTSAQYLRDFILTQQTAIRGSSTTGGAGYGIGDRGLPVETFELTMVPTSNADGDYSESFCFWEAGLGEGVSLSLAGNKNEFQSVDVEFVAYPQLDGGTEGFRYGIFGNAAAIGDEPAFVFITSGEAVAPYSRVSAMTLGTNAAANMQAYGYWETASGTTAAINQVGGINATDQTVTYDTLVGSFAVGDVIGIGTERMTVTSVSSTVLGITRAAFGSVAASALDDAVITRYSWYIVRMTDQNSCAWASSAPADVAVGNTAGGTGTARKGYVYWVSPGSGNVTAEVTSDDGLTTTTSQNLAVTAS